jgi:hypothetical protein
MAQATRHQTTIENRSVCLRTTPKQIAPADINTALAILNEYPMDRSKWFTAAAVGEYQTAIYQQLVPVKQSIIMDPHSRQIVIHGPVGACWLSTVYLSLPNGNYHVSAHYRSLDTEHTDIDLAFQYVLGQEVTFNRVEEIYILASSHHTYK